MQVLGSLLFYTGLVLSTLFFTVVSLFAFPLPFRQRARLVGRSYARFNLWWLGLTCNVRWRVSGREHIPDVPSIIVAKHQSAWETLALQLIFPPHSWVLKRELLWIPFFGWGLGTLDPIAINRGSALASLRQIVEGGRQRLASGHWVMIFPEGTRVAPGERRPYGIGAGALAARSGSAVVPVAHNAGLCWPRSSFLKYPGVIDVVIGPVIETRGRKAAAITAQAEQWIEQTSAELVNRRQGDGARGSE